MEVAQNRPLMGRLVAKTVISGGCLNRVTFGAALGIRDARIRSGEGISPTLLMEGTLSFHFARQTVY
jgi:hypothetical protein